MRSTHCLVLFCVAMSAGVAAQTSSIDSLRQRYPTASIDSTAHADAALVETQGAKLRVDKEYKADARACLRTVLVNDCLDRVRELRRKRLADIDAVELDANRFKRRERNERIEAERARREADRSSKEAADAALRTKNREAFEGRQAEAAKAAVERKRSDAIHQASAARPHRPLIKVPPAGDAQANLNQRSKNAADYRKKVATAAAHQQEIDRRIVEKDADRKHRAETKAAKDSKTASAAAAAAAAAAQSPFATTQKP